MTNTVSRIISDETLSRIIQIESAGRPNAKAPTSSASGLGQFIKATWLATVKRHRPTWSIGKSDDELLALRFDPQYAIEMLARFTEDNAAALGSGWTDGDLYLAHFAGVGTARQLMRALPERPASAVFSPPAIKANRSILEGKTCGQVRAWAAAKMAKAGGRNWVAVYMAGAKPVAPPKSKAATGAVVAGGAGTVATAAQQGWGATEWLILGGVVAGIAAAAFFIWWHFKNRNQPVHLDIIKGE